jgi:glycosyltransferase involved in cell wall biosynthesis
MPKKSLLIFYDHFYPAYKAGGPIRSLGNLVKDLSKYFQVSIITSAYDLNYESQLNGVTPNSWCSFNDCKIFYCHKDYLTVHKFKKLLSVIKPNVIYLNGLFSKHLFLKPLLAISSLRSFPYSLIISPRGMLQAGAMRNKFLGKWLYLKCLKLFLLRMPLAWHATSTQEAKDIQKYFGKKVALTIIPNIPISCLSNFQPIKKEKGQLRLLYLSIIAQKKNLLFALTCLKDLNLPIQFHVYGPVKDKSYWEKCTDFIQTIAPHIQVEYCGDVDPFKVQEVYVQYHALFLPTQGENFGHAIFECLSAGRPVLISNTTPWNLITQKEAGFALATGDKSSFIKALQSLWNADQDVWNSMATNALAIAKGFEETNHSLSDYLQLFNYIP